MAVVKEATQTVLVKVYITHMVLIVVCGCILAPLFELMEAY